MAIGNVGTYATVEGAPVDFAKLISSNVKDYQDRQDEQEKQRQAQAAAAAKARDERIKDIKAFGNVSLTGNTSIDDASSQAVFAWKQKYIEGSDLWASGDYTGKQMMNEAESGLDILKQAPEVINAQTKDITDHPEKYNKSYSKEALSMYSSIGHGKMASRLENGQLKFDIYPTDDDGNITSHEPMRSGLTAIQLAKGNKIPAAYSMDDEVAKFRTNNTQVLNEFYNSANTMKTGVKKLTPSMISNIDTMADAASRNDDAMAQLVIDAKIGDPKQGYRKWNGYTDDDRAKAKEHLKEYLTNTFQKEVRQDYTHPQQSQTGTTPGGENFVPGGSFVTKSGKASNDYSIGAKSKAISINDPSGKKEDNIFIESMGKWGGVVNPTTKKVENKKIGTISHVSIESALYDKDGRFIIKGTYPISKSSTWKDPSSGKSYSMLSDTPPTGLTGQSLSDWEEAKKSSETQGIQYRTIVQPVGKDTEAAVARKMSGRVINGVKITDVSTMKQAMGYSDVSNKTIQFNADGSIK